jgi:two-component system NtrC family sensor kinase
MLVLSKPEQEPQQLVDVSSLLDDLLLFVERQMREQTIGIERAFDETLPEIMASPAQLRRVFLNMLRNARDAMPTGGTLHVETVRHDYVVEVRIADTGVGIREEHRNRIFDAFFTTKGKMKGVGLGLSVAYTSIKAQGGDIRVESTLGKGSTFIVTLPLHSSI